MMVLRFLLSALILITAIYAWGKVRTYVARNHLNKGLAYLEKSKPLEAIREFQEATTDLGCKPEIWHYLALAFCQAGDGKDAREALEKALRTQPGYGPALKLLQQLDQHHLT